MWGLGARMWTEILVGLSFVLVIEGIIPFLSPGRWRSLAATMAGVDDRTLRIIGLVSMLAGTALLYLVRVWSLLAALARGAKLADDKR